MIGYLDLPSGISGDMFLGCLFDAGWPVEALRETLRRVKLPVAEWRVDAAQVMKGPLRATLADVVAQEGHHHRHLRHVREIIEGGDIPPEVKERAVAVFTRLAEAEAKVHGTTKEKIHFHEVGAVDAIIDIVGAVAGLHALGVERLFASPLPLGDGWAQTDHGQIPLPGPATLELLAAAKAPTRPAAAPGEWVTPTGAALVAELAEFGQPAMEVHRVGTGAGRKDAAWPNVARLWLGFPTPGSDGGGMVELQTNIDDMNPQLFAAVGERLFQAGARDVWLTPVQMKKGRPAVVVSVLCAAVRGPVLTDILLRETTTLGVRTVPLLGRTEARREKRPVTTPWGEVSVKVKYVGGEAAGASPEYDDCVRVARDAGVAVKAVYEAAAAEAHRLVTALAAGEGGHGHGHTHGGGHTHDHGHSHSHSHSHSHAHGEGHSHSHGSTHDHHHGDPHGHPHPHDHRHDHDPGPESDLAHGHDDPHPH